MPEEIIQAARAELSPTDLRAEDLLDEIHRQRDQSRKARAATDKARQEAETLRSELTRRLEKIEDERRQVLEKARKEAEENLQELQDEMSEARKALAKARQPLEVLEAVAEQVEVLQETFEAPVERRQAEVPGQPVRRAIRLGDKVRLRTLNTNGVVTSLGEDEAELQIGALRIRARLAELQLAGEPEPAAGGRTSMPDGQLPTARDLLAARKSRPEAILPESPGIELDLRGQRAEEALDALDRYLDAAYLAGLPWVRIIHGKGTGKLRLSVREALSNHPHIKSFESGGEKEGGDGVTVAKLAL
jgi:DNA mismatch repair protein MutS2